MSVNKPVSFNNRRVTVYQDGSWKCKSCHKKAITPGIKPPGEIPPGKRCTFKDENTGSLCNKHYSEDPDLAEIRQRREEEAQLNAKAAAARRNLSPREPQGFDPVASDSLCHLFGTCLSIMATPRGGTRKHKKTRGRKTHGRKLRGRKTRARKPRGRKTGGRKRKNIKNTRYQKRAR